VSRRAIVALVALSLSSLVACASGPLSGTSRCLPSPLKLSSARIPAGGVVRLSSAPFACHASYPTGKKYTLALGQAGRGGPLSLGSVPVNRDGSFSAAVRLPANASPGGSYLVVQGSAFDQPCKDTASCASYAVGLIVLAGHPAGP
jgi:hypothetical protein